MCFCCGTFYRDTKLGRCCRWILPIIVHSLILYLYVAFTYYVTLQLFDELPPRPRAELILFQVSGVLCVISLARCLWDTRSTTVLREASEQLATKKKEDGGAILDQGCDSSGDVLPASERKYDGRRRYCRKCSCLKPDRTHHCSSCKRCVLKMDHHCCFLNKCIGFYNYKFFLLFLFWSFVSCLCQSHFIFTHLLGHIVDSIVSLRYPHSELQILLVFIASSALALGLGCFTVFQLSLAIANRTTIEYWEQRGEEGGPRYSIGPLLNLYEVFGYRSDKWKWLLPLDSESALRGRGIVFQIKEE